MVALHIKLNGITYAACCCICDYILFDMQHDHVLKKMNSDPNARLGWGGGRGSVGKIFATMLLHVSFPLICNET